MTTSSIAGKGGAERPRSPADKNDAGNKREEFQSILESIASEQGYRPSPPKALDNRVDSAPSVEPEPEKNDSQREMISPGRCPAGSEEVMQGERVGAGSTLPQKERPEVPPNQEEGRSVRTVPDRTNPSGTLTQPTLDAMRQTSVNPDMPGRELTVEIDILATATGSSVPSETLVRDIVEKDGGFLQVLGGQEGQILQKGKNRDKGPITAGSLGDTIDRDSRRGENHLVIAGFDGDGGESGEHGRTMSNDVLNALSLNASRKYGIVAGEKEGGTGSIIENTVDRSPQKTDIQAVQYGVFNADAPQIREDNAVFEQGSFSSFLRERIEKIVEQYSSRNTGADMVVRLKLDDQETILVGLKHTTEKLVVEVKASNEGLVNLLQSYKEDIIRHLEDRNIFTRIYVDQDGQNGFDRRSRRESGTNHGRRKMLDGFDSLLDAIV